MTIAEVSKKFELAQDTLRYYERIGLIPEVNRNKNGSRDYDEEDLKWIEFIKCMRNTGIPIEALIEYVMLLKQGNKTVDARKELLKEQRAKLLEKIEDMKKTLDRLDYKMERYEKGIVPKENDLKRPEN